MKKIVFADRWEAKRNVWQSSDLWRLLWDFTRRLENHQSKSGDLCRLILAKSHSSDSQVDTGDTHTEREKDVLWLRLLDDTDDDDEGIVWAKDETTKL